MCIRDSGDSNVCPLCGHGIGDGSYIYIYGNWHDSGDGNVCPFCSHGNCYGNWHDLGGMRARSAVTVAVTVIATVIGTISVTVTCAPVLR